MAAKKTTLSNSMLDLVLRHVSFSSPTNVYVALFTGNESAGSQGAEVSGNGYQRTAVSFSAATSGSTSNSASVDFPTATGSWGTVTGAAICASDVEGTDDALYFGALATSKTVGSGDQLSFASGSLIVSES